MLKTLLWLFCVAFPRRLAELLLEPVDVEEDSVQLLLVGIGGGGRIGGTSESTGRSEHISTEQALLL